MTRKHKFIFLIFTINVAVFIGNLKAQQLRQPDTEFVAPKKFKKAPPKRTEQESFFKLNGSLTQAVKSKQPWQVVSPLAPSSYGTGEQNVSQDPDEEGRNEGLLLFGIQW